MLYPKGSLFPENRYKIAKNLFNFILFLETEPIINLLTPMNLSKLIKGRWFEPKSFKIAQNDNKRGK